MNEVLARKIGNAFYGNVYATQRDNERVKLVRLGTHEEIRQRYNQMVCLIAANAMRAIAASSSMMAHSTAAAPGSWFDRFENQPIGSFETLFGMAACAPTVHWNSIGYLAWHGDWPVGTSKLSGMKNMAESMAKIGDIIYGVTFRASVPTGEAAEVSVYKRLQEAVVASKRLGHTPYEEEKLLQFASTLSTAPALHFFHEIVA